MLKLTLKKIEDQDDEVQVKEEVHAIPHATGLHFRKVVEFDASINYTDLSLEEMDKVVGFVCEVFRNRFTVEDFYEGTPSHQLISRIGEVFTFVRTGKTVEELQKEAQSEQDEVGKK
ncbi:phage tail assembly chaperone G [Alkalihalophilus marmarensis]|uniref:phage tail assembly chaperone G n=1 Tax=Alkalihalophilus marmarensis TaxID=521377 RepID=UPI002E23649B|nr:hypothetical protein [Alkalihalophilus marmarensis]